MTILSTAGTVTTCVDFVLRVAPLLERTPDEATLRQLDEHADALLHLPAHQHGENPARVAVALSRWCLDRGRYQDGIHLLLQSRAHYGLDVPLSVRTRACQMLAVLWQRLQEFRVAEDYLCSALQLSSDLNDLFVLGYTHHYLGLLYRRTHRYDLAAASHTRSLDVWCNADDTWGIATAHNSLGVLALAQHDLQKAYACLSTALRHFSSIDDMKQSGAVLNNMGLVAGERGMLDHALDAYSKSARIFRKSGDLNSLGLALYNQGDIQFERQQYDKARALLIESLEIACRLEYTLYAADAVNNLAFIAQRTGEYKQSAVLTGVSDTLCQKRTTRIPAAVLKTKSECDEQNKAALCGARSALLRKGRSMSLPDVLAYLRK